MQILTMEFAGIGPFTGRHHLDFRALGEGGLFLLEGPTGSGKTTIIDAIVFALYGDVAGVDSSKGRLVSTQLPAGVEPYVDLTVDTTRGLLRVRRVPQHERRKARGTGTTVGKANIKLWKLAYPGDEGTLLSTSLPEASEELQRALGLTKEQFTQTVVLPQGHFATFLRAKPEDRRGVLQDIFGTEFYERLARRLSELASGYRAQDAAARAALDRAAASVATVAWAAEDAERAAFVASLTVPESAVELARARVQVLAGQASEAAIVADGVRDVLEVAEAELRGVLERNAAIAERAQLTQRLGVLQGASEQVQAAAVEAEAAERAEQVRHPLEAVVRAAAAQEASGVEAARGIAAAAGGPDADLVASGADPDALDAESIAAREARSALTMVVEIEASLANRAEALKLDVNRLAARRADAKRERARIADDRAEASRHVAELGVLRAIADTRAEAMTVEVQARASVEAVRRLESVASEFLEARRVEQGAREAAAEASGRHDDARTAWLNGLAGTLAAELGAGQPCPVCGSTKHPARAVRPAGAVSRDEVERLDAVARRAEQLASAAQAHSDALATAMSDQQDAVGAITRVEAESALVEASERLRLVEVAAAQASGLASAIEALVAGADERERRLRDAEQALATDTGNLGARTERLDADRQRVAEELAGFGSVAERAAALGRRAERARRLALLVRQAGDGRRELAGREAELAAVLIEQGFDSADAARAALRSASERKRLASVVADHRAALATVTERLADERLVVVAGVEPVDEQPSRAAASEAREALAQAQSRLGSASSAASLAGEACDELARCAGQLAELKAAAEPYLRMADLATGVGANQAGVTLPTFVLLRRFEEVVDLANARLDAMTGGRYSLRRTDAREGRSHKLGLGLEVVDHASGDATRDPKTLSGGETFQASLAMALGLADAVTAEAGGVELSTLFVDEGFGSLDPEALDLVMDQLSALRDGGRCVGVVSHVAEMKQRIAERVTVIPRRDGTSTLSCSTDPQPALAG